jgi:hypothetical protein
MRQQKRDDDVSAKIGWSPEGTGDGGTRPWHVCPRCRELKHLFFRRQRIKINAIGDDKRQQKRNGAVCRECCDGYSHS